MMRCLDRNKKSFYYATYQGITKQTDSEGNFTGEYGISYSTPVQAYGNISPAKGNDFSSPFGVAENYDKIIVMADPNFPVETTSVLWIENATTDPYDYIVVKVARSLNSVSIAVRKVDVSA